MAYTNFTNCTKQEYYDIIYSESSTNRIKIWFNNVELQDADEYCISLKQKDSVLPTDGNKTFTLSNFISKELELVLRDLPEETTIEDQVRISIGTLVDANNNTYEDVPLGVFNIQDTPTTDQNKVTIKLRDNRVKFDFKYNAQPLIDVTGSTTLGAILDDICEQAGVVNNVGRFKGESIEIGIYDNTITGTTYVGYIAEQCGMIPKIDRDGSLIFVNLVGDKQSATIDSSATLENVSSGITNDVVLKGNTTQTTTTGKNLAKLEPTSGRIGSIDFSVNNGVINVSGTTTGGSSNFVFDSFRTNSGSAVFWIEVKGYTDKSSDNSFMILQESPDNSTWTTKCELSLNSGHDKLRSITLESSKYYRVRWYVANNTFTNATIKVQLEYGSSKTTFEPYTNGPSPNPSYPQEVNNVSGLQTIDIYGSNLYNYQDATTVHQDITVDDEGWITATYDNSSGSSIAYMNYFTNNLPLEYDTNYGVFTEIKNVSGSGTIYISSTSQTYGQFSQTKYYEFYNLTSDTTKKDIIKTKTSTDAGNHSGLRTFLRFGAGQSGSITFRLSVIKDTTLSIENFKYEPYKGNTYEINLGKNLWQNSDYYTQLTTDNYTITNGGFTFTRGTLSGGAYISKRIPVENGKTYTFSSNNTANPTSDLYMVLYRGNVYGTQLKASYTGTLTYTATTSEDLFFTYIINSGLQTAEVSNIQVEKGSQATSYSEYFTPIELCKIGDYQDRIFKSNGKNLFDYINANFKNNYYIGTDGNEVYNSSFRYTQNYYSVNANETYTFSNLSVGSKMLSYYDNSKTFIGYLGFFSDSTKKFTTPNNCKYVILSCPLSTDISQAMLNEGTTALDYEPYGEPSWYIEKKIGKATLDSSNYSNRGTTGTNAYYLGTNITTLSNNDIAIAYCNMFQPVSFANRQNGLDVTYSQNGNLTLRTANNTTINWSDATNCQNWLNANKPITYYILAIPTYTKITNNDLIDQLENIRLLTGLNNINSSVPLDFVYFKEKEHYRIPLSIVEKYELGTPFDIQRVVYESGIVKYETGADEELSTLYLNSANPYVIGNNQVDDVYSMLGLLNIDSVKTGKILGNPAIDSYDIIEVYDDEDVNQPVIFRTFANNDLTYNGVNIQTFETNISQEARKENVTSNSSETFQKYAKTLIDSINGEVIIQAGKIDGLNDEFSEFKSKQNGFEFKVTSLSEKVDGIDTTESKKLKNELVSIDNQGIHVSNDESEIQTNMTNDSFSITSSSSGKTLADFRYDEESEQSYAEMDNLTVETYFIAGNHRVEKRGDRTYWYYIGGN